MEKQFVAMKAFIVNEDNNTLLLIKKGSKDVLNPGKWEVPGGKMEFNETFHETLKREVKEECGIDIEVGKQLIKPWQWTFTNPKGDKIQIIAVGKICRALTKEINYNNQTDTDGIIDSKWVPIQEILNYDLIPNLIPTMKEFINIYLYAKSNNLSVFEADEDHPLYCSEYTSDITLKHH